VDAGGYLAGTIERGGDCTLTITRGQQSFTGSSKAFEDATSTSCSSVRVPVPAGLDGEWQAVLRYESVTTEAVSAPFPVTVR
jgi:hypothetical protein